MYSHIITSNYVSVMNMETGNVTKITKEQPAFLRAVELIREFDYAGVESLTPKIAVQRIIEQGGDASGFRVRLDNANIFYSFNGGKEQILNNAMTERIVRMAQEGFDISPLIKFMENLLSNTSKTAIDELYLFLENTELPITSDGHFIAYKIVRNDYTSIHDPSFRNDVGTVVEMPRNEVCDDRNKTCSYGLHFCSKAYLNAYGSKRRDTDRIVLVKINPADVVSIPADYNNAKGRASKYLIWKDITDAGWRETLSRKDYTDSAVELGDWDEDYDEDDYDEEEDGWNDAPVCPTCYSPNVIKKGTTIDSYGTMKQRYKCKDCGKNFSKVIV